MHVHLYVHVHVQFQLLFEQFHLRASIHSGVRHDMAPHLALRVFHCEYNIFLVKTLT